MKKVTFLSITALLMSVLILTTNNSFSQVYQLDNPGFEDWDEGNGEEPTHWNSFPSAKVDISIGSSLVTGKKHDRSTDTRPGSTGSYSCKIYSSSINIVFTTIVANGTMTTGRIRVGSTSTTSSENYNYTVADDANYRQQLNAKPDSLVFWARYFNSNDADEASVHAYIHDNYSFKDPGDVSNQTHLVGKAEANFTNGGKVWVRHSYPFVYAEGNCNDPQYILLTFTTNKTAGGGAANDSLLIDDIEFIYNPIEIERTQIACDSYIWGDTTITASGDYTRTFEAEPADSTVILHLTINHAVTNEFSIDTCNSFTWNDSTYTTTDDIEHTYTAENGCDSIVTLHLTIRNSVSYEFSANAEGEYHWNDSIYTVSGDYEQTFTAENSCDSVVTLHLTITTTGIDQNINSEISVFPNPANDKIMIEGANIASIRICNMLGQELMENRNNGANSITISTETLEVGNYIILIDNGTQTIARRITIMR